MIKRKKGKYYQFREGQRHGEDLRFYINLAREGALYADTEEPVLYYRKGHQSAMSNQKGLEKGYRSIYSEIVGMQDIPEELKRMYLKKAKSIMLKSYLGNNQPLSALNAYFSNW
jgi:hypothetical protein